MGVLSEQRLQDEAHNPSSDLEGNHTECFVAPRGVFGPQDSCWTSRLCILPRSANVRVTGLCPCRGWKCDTSFIRDLFFAEGKKEVHRAFGVWINLLEIKSMLQSGSGCMNTSCMTEEKIIHTNLLPYKRQLLLVPGRGSSYQYIELSSKMNPQEPRKLHQHVSRAWRIFHMSRVTP